MNYSTDCINHVQTSLDTSSKLASRRDARYLAAAHRGLNLDTELQRALEPSTEVKENTVNPWTYPTLMAFQTTYIGDGEEGKFELKRRRPYTTEMNIAGVKYNADKHYKSHETSPLFDAILAGRKRPNGEPVTYGWVTMEATGKKAKKAAIKWARRVTRSGMTDSITKTKYRVIYGQYIDDGKLLLVPADSGIKTLADLGIFMSDDPKGAKRFRRDSAAHQMMLEFDIIDRKVTADGTVFTLRHKTLNVEFEYLSFDMSTLNDEETSFVDGMNQVNIFAQLFGEDYEHIKYTGVINGTDKGFGHANDLVKFGVVAYGTKQELILNGDRAYLGVLGELHLHDAYMDIQTFVNMGFYEEDLCPTEGRYWMNQIATTMFSEDEDAIRDLFAVFARINNQKDPDGDEYDTDYTAPKPEDKWASVRADELMIESKTMPVLFRRRFKTVFENSIDLVRGRIPMMRKFKRLNVAPNPLAFLASGRPCKALDVLGDDVCCWDMAEGLMWMARNPNTHKGEAIVVNNRHIPELKKYRGRGLVFFGFGAGKHLSKLNGGDMDDSVIATCDMAYINKWNSFTYPVVDKIKVTADRTIATNNPYLTSQKDKYQPKTGEWNMHILYQEMDRWTKYEIGLGTFINRIMLDILLSGENRTHGIEWLKSQKQTDDVKAAIHFLENKEDNILRREASNSDLVIDWLQMRKGNKEVVDSLLDHSAEVLDTPVFPMCYAERIPFDRKAKKDYILIETKACKALNALKLVRDQIIETARQTESMLVRGIPSAVDNLFPSYEFVSESAHIVRSTWRELWDNLRAEYEGKSLPEDSYRWLANGHEQPVEILPTDADFNVEKAKKGLEQFRIVKHDGLSQSYFFYEDGTEVDKDTRIATAVEIYRQIYSKTTEPEMGEDGFTMSFGDGVPDFILHDFMTACEQAGVTGIVEYAHLNGYAKDRLTAPVQVKVVSGRIYRHSDARLLGKVAVTVPNGTYKMSPKGVIVVAESKPELHSSYKVDETTKLVRGEVDDFSMNEDVDDIAFSF